jgi:hypothetical protein
MKHSRYIKLSAFALVLLLMLTSIFSTTYAEPSLQATATEENLPPQSTAQPTDDTISDVARCVPTEVTVFVRSPRIHVKCAAATENIIYFAVGTENAEVAHNVLTVLLAAKTSGQALSIVYNPDNTQGEEIGCQAADCRLIISVSLVD